MNNILEMAREGLRRDLTSALGKAAVTREVVRCPGLRVKTNGEFTTLNLTVRPVAPDLAALTQGKLAEETEEPLFLVILQDVPTVERASAPQAAGAEAVGLAAEPDDRVAALKQELRAKEEYLQTANEELETSNEELKSTNEELQSTNEELQATKEELQSVNEELATVNAELQDKVADLSRANDDMNNLLSGTGIATVFVDHALRILRFTPTASRIMNVILSDVGRPVAHIVPNLVGNGHLTAAVQAVLDTLIPQETAVQTLDGRWYTMRILPYRTLQNVIEGAVITFVDITEMRKAQETLREMEERYRTLAQDPSTGILVCDTGTAVLLANASASRLLGLTEDEMRGKTAADLAWRFLREDGTAMPLAEYPVSRVLSSGEPVAGYVVGVTRPDREKPDWVLIHAYPVRDPQNRLTHVVVTLANITASNIAETRRTGAMPRERWAGSEEQADGEGGSERSGQGAAQ